MRACDRCKRAGATHRYLTREMCPSCCSAFDAWWERGRKSAGQPPRATVGTPWKLISRLIEKHGSVTAEQYAAVSGQVGRAPYYALRSFVRKGWLESDRMADGSVQFFFSTSRWQRPAEAAE